MIENKKIPNNYLNIVPKEDTKNFIRNPYMGWVVYVEYTCSLHNINKEENNQSCIDANCPEQFFLELDNEIKKV